MADLLSQKTQDELKRGATTEQLNMNRPKMGFLDHVIYGLVGAPDQMLTPDDLNQRQQRRAEAGAMAKGAGENPGESFMSAPNPGGSGGGLNDIIKTVATLFG